MFIFLMAYKKIILKKGNKNIYLASVFSMGKLLQKHVEN